MAEVCKTDQSGLNQYLEGGSGQTTEKEATAEERQITGNNEVSAKRQASEKEATAEERQTTGNNEVSAKRQAPEKEATAEERQITGNNEVSAKRQAPEKGTTAEERRTAGNHAVAARRQAGGGQACRVILSKRLQMLADMVTPGNRLVDVGCDHGYLCISLVGSGISPGAIAMDVRQGPLAAAKAHVAEHGLNGYIDVRLSDGMAGCESWEADTLVCAGMGGRLMERILREGMEKARGMRELILQPQSELPQFRMFLRANGFEVIDEDAVFEEGKYYFAMKAVYAQCTDEAADTGENGGNLESAPTEPLSGRNRRGSIRQHLYDLYGQQLLQERHPVLLQYLGQREAYIRKLEISLASAGTLKAEKRLREVRGELEDIRAACMLLLRRS